MTAIAVCLGLCLFATLLLQTLHLSFGAREMQTVLCVLGVIVSVPTLLHCVQKIHRVQEIPCCLRVSISHYLLTILSQHCQHLTQHIINTQLAFFVLV